MTPSLTTIGNVGLYLLALVAARLAIRTARTPQGATGWVVFLLSFPVLAIPAYVIFGGIYRMNKHRAPQAPDQKADATQHVGARLSDLQRTAESTLSPDNNVLLVVNGQATFEAIFEAMDNAKCEILVQYYTLRDDALGEEMKQRLIDATRRGVTVRVLVDAMGSYQLSRSFIAELRDAGVDFRGNFALRRSFYRLGINYRNHRKTVLVDGDVAFTGGLNASQLYIDGADEFDDWRDTFLRIEGPIVTQIQRSFASDWKALTDEDLPEFDSGCRKAGDILAMHVEVGPTEEHDTGLLLILGLIGKARERLWITTPYLVPPPEVAAALKLAAERGIDVRILVPQSIDKYLPWLASRSIFQSFHSVGIGIHEYLPGFTHQKVILVDDDIASIGTINLDFRSIMLNFEQTVLIEDKDFCKEVAQMLAEDFANSERYDGEKQRLWIRLFAPVAQLLAPVL